MGLDLQTVWGEAEAPERRDLEELLSCVTVFRGHLNADAQAPSCEEESTTPPVESPLASPVPRRTQLCPLLRSIDE